MYKVFIVEDEIVVRENIREHFPWEGSEFVYAGEASDGEIALPMIEETQPHIVITDIKMPFLDGLALSRILKQNMPWIKIIILTGHDEFDYARQALSIGVTEYILKPIGAEDLLEVLNRTAVILKHEDQERHNIDHLQKLLKDSTDYMAERFLNDLVIGALTPGQVIENASRFNLDIMGSYYAVLLLYTDSVFYDDKLRYDEFLKVDSIINQLMKSNKDIITFKRNLKETVLIFKGTIKDEISNICYRIGQSVKVEVEDKTSCTLSINIGGVKERIQGISESFQEAEQTKGFNFFFGDNKIIGIEDTKLAMLKFNEPFPFEREELIIYLRQGQVKDLDQFIITQMNLLKKLGKAAFIYAFTYFNIFREVSRFIFEIGGSPEKDLEEYEINFPRLLNMDLEEHVFTHKVIQLMQAALNFREEKKKNSYSKIIMKAKDYIDNNFVKSDLSLADVAGIVNISASHFSNVFSQQNKKTFIEYLTNVRVSRAKELLNTTELKSSEIAYEVGYNDSHYFCHIFKKATGMTPGIFRNGKNSQV